jgi:hypothetical protein
MKLIQYMLNESAGNGNIFVGVSHSHEKDPKKNPLPLELKKKLVEQAVRRAFPGNANRIKVVSTTSNNPRPSYLVNNLKKRYGNVKLVFGQNRTGQFNWLNCTKTYCPRNMKDPKVYSATRAREAALRNNKRAFNELTANFNNKNAIRALIKGMLNGGAKRTSAKRTRSVR